MTTRTSLSMLAVAALSGLLGGLVGSYLLGAPPAHAQRDWDLPERPPTGATVPAGGFLFRTADGRVAARLDADRGGTTLTLVGMDGALIRLGAGTHNSTVHVEADGRNLALLTNSPEKSELVLRGSGRTTLEGEAGPGGGELRVDGRVLSGEPLQAAETSTDVDRALRAREPRRTPRLGR